MAWRHQWHWWGKASLQQFTLSRLDEQGNVLSSVQLPDFASSSDVQTTLGQFRLMAYSNRDRFPKVGRWEMTEKSEKTGVFVMPGIGSHARLHVEKQTLTLATNGRAKSSRVYDWAPALVFDAKEPGIYRISGHLQIQSGKPVDQKTMTWAVIKFNTNAKKPTAARVNLHRAIRPILNGQSVATSNRWTPAVDYDPTPLASLDFSHSVKKQAVEKITPILKQWLSGVWPNYGVVMVVEDEKGMMPSVKIKKNMDAQITVRSHPSNAIYDFPVKPKADTYVQAKGTHLMYGKERLRLWGVAGTVSSPETPRRLARNGFNAIRLWPQGGQQNKNPYYHGESGIKGEMSDNEQLDRYDKYLAALKEQGMFVMSPFLIRSIPVKLLVDDRSFVAGGDDWQQWKEAVQTKCKNSALWETIDERLQDAHKRHIHNVLNHVNPYTQKTYGQEEIVAVWELDNEAKLIKIALEIGFDKWPVYFQDKLKTRWNLWLKSNYPNHEALLHTWGKIEDGESLKQLNIAPAPVFKQRNNFPKARGNDFVRFMIQLISEHYKRLEDYARQQAPTGIGVNVQPFSYDTQYRPNTPWHYGTAQQADVANFGMYFFALDSTLDNPPSMYVMDSHTLANKPTVIYETNSGRPGTYRVEHAYRTATLASWQDWDAVFWHYYHSRGWPEEQYLATPLPYQKRQFYWTAVEFEKDPVMLSTIGMAGQIYLKQQIDPASNPVHYRIGSKGIFGYKQWNGISMGQATFERGAVIDYVPDEDFDIKREDNLSMDIQTRITQAVRAGKQITWDWPNGRLIVDTPHAKIYVGKTPSDQGWYRFTDGIAVGQFNTDFVAFAMTSCDGKPLVGSDPANRLYVNARYDAVNSGFDMDMSIRNQPNAGNPIEQAKFIKNHGHAPILETAVAFKVALPQNIQASWQTYDAAYRKISTFTINGNVLDYHGPAMSNSILQISAFKDAAQTPQTTIVMNNTEQLGISKQNQDTTESVSTLWYPLAGLTWSDTYGKAHKKIRESPLVYTHLKADDKKQNLITLNQAQVLFNLPADIQIYFDHSGSNKVSLVYSQPPAMLDVIEQFTQRFGKPTQKVLSTNAYQENRIVWEQAQNNEHLKTIVTENQGVLQIIFERSK
ncbi:MAG TPA: hypothetical protein DER01_12640 [Phycisphaerales bacterium]|nr:hypothetical protein [Phycisphaerales bacterium]